MVNVESRGGKRNSGVRMHSTRGNHESIQPTGSSNGERDHAQVRLGASRVMGDSPARCAVRDAGRPVRWHLHREESDNEGRRAVLVPRKTTYLSPSEAAPSRSRIAMQKATQSALILTQMGHSTS